MFDRLDATVLVERADARLRAIGANVPRGARASTRANVGGLTDREMDVLDLLDAGLRNSEIAARLHLSEKTVGNHVSAILAKFGVSSRLEAVRHARDLAAVGLVLCRRGSRPGGHAEGPRPDLDHRQGCPRPVPRRSRRRCVPGPSAGCRPISRT